MLDPGQILVPANFNPASQVYEPAHPNREGIFTSLTPAADDDSGGRNKLLWKQGYRTLRWTAADPNGDELVYDLSFRPASTAGDREGDWLEVVNDLKEDHYSFDATVAARRRLPLPSAGPTCRRTIPTAALVAERVSDPVVIDHTPPGWWRRTNGRQAPAGHGARRRRARCGKPSSASTREEWKPVRAADGLLDGRTETLLIEPGEAGATWCCCGSPTPPTTSSPSTSIARSDEQADRRLPRVVRPHAQRPPRHHRALPAAVRRGGGGGAARTRARQPLFTVEERSR